MKKPVAVLLCAGEGTRMNDQRTNKVCYEVAGVPVIIRTISSMREAGIENFVCVVGSKAEKVMECLKDVPGVTYAFQSERKGTGDAAMCGLKVLDAFDYDGPVLIAMGDKIISPDVFVSMAERYDAVSKKPVLAVQPREFNRSGGRICIKDGAVCGIYEMLDSALLYLAGCADKTEAGLQKAIDSLGINEKKKGKLLRAFAEAGDKLKNSTVLAGKSFTYDEIESGGYVNTATYIVDAKEIRSALLSVGDGNVQNEIYVTDALNKIISENGAEILPVSDKAKMLTYSTMEELLSLNRYFVKPDEKDEDIPYASERIYTIKLWGDDVARTFRDIYGDNPELIEERKNRIIALLEAFIDKFGDRRVVVSRSPGRVNLLGRHIEHRGGSINVMSVNRETLVVAAPREDDMVHIANLDPKYSERTFGIIESLRDFTDGDWLEFIENDATLQMILESRGDWVNYVKASVLRLQMNQRKHLIRGMDMLFCGNIPQAAGLSSSSSIVVATTEAAIALNHLDIKAKDFIHLCGEGEWFVGSRGGAGDHAAIKCSKRDMITHIKFCPFEIGESVEFSHDYNIVVANSFVEAKKSDGARDKFNQKVACYEIGFMLIKKNHPQFEGKLNYLKDINQKTLGITQARVYKMILSLPEYMTKNEIYNALPEKKKELDRIMKTHAEAKLYEIRSTILYGVAECQRADLCLDLLKRGDYVKLGRLMNVSHNGDRVSRGGESYDYSAGDAYLLSLIDDLESEDPDRVFRAQIYNQPGGYGCSTETIDDLVDFAVGRPGVMGAELSGAGLGGCVIILVKKDKTEHLLSSLKEYYYDKNNLPMGAQVFIPVAGSMAL